MAELPTASSPPKGGFEIFVNLIDVVSDWSFIALIVLLIFRKQIGPHISELFKEVVNLISRIKSFKVGGTEVHLQFTPLDLRNLATQYDPAVLHNLFLNVRETAETADSDEEEPIDEAESEKDEIEARIRELMNQQD